MSGMMGMMWIWILVGILLVILLIVGHHQAAQDKR